MPKSKSPLRFLITGAGIQMATLVISAAIGFLLTPLMIHTLGDRDFGLFDLVGSFAGWLGLVDFGLSGAVARFVAVAFSRDNKNESEAIAATGFVLYLALGIVAFVLAALSTLTLPWLLSDPKDVPLVRLLMLLTAASFAIELPLRALSGLLNGYMRRDITSWLTLLSRIIRAGATVAILFVGGRLIALSVASLILTAALAILWWNATKRTVPDFHVELQLVSSERLRSLLSFGGLSFIGRMAEAVIFRLDGFVIAWFIAIAAVPHYAIAVALATYFQSAMVAMTGWLMNWFAHKDASGRQAVTDSLYLSTRYCIVIGGFGLFGLIAFGKPFIERWMGPAYLDAYPCLVALSIGEFVRSCQSPNVNLLFARAKLRVFAITRVLEAILNLLLSIVLVQKHGILGVALGTMLASIVVNGLLLPLICCVAMQESVTRYGTAVLHGLTVTVLLVTMPALIVTAKVTPNYGSLVLLGVISVCIYFPLAFALGTSRNERKRLFASYLG